MKRMYVILLAVFISVALVSFATAESTRSPMGGLIFDDPEQVLLVLSATPDNIAWYIGANNSVYSSSIVLYHTAQEISPNWVEAYKPGEQGVESVEWGKVADLPAYFVKFDYNLLQAHQEYTYILCEGRFFQVTWVSTVTGQSELSEQKKIYTNFLNSFKNDGTLKPVSGAPDSDGGNDSGGNDSGGNDNGGGSGGCDAGFGGLAVLGLAVGLLKRR